MPIVDERRSAIGSAGTRPISASKVDNLGPWTWNYPAKWAVSLEARMYSPSSRARSCSQARSMIWGVVEKLGW